MKKLFTLVALCACLGAYADTESLDLSAGYMWSGTYDAETQTAKFAAQWDAMDHWIGGEDWSAYSAIVVAWDSSSADEIGISVAVKDSDNNSATSDYVTATTETSITVDITSIDRTSINQWWVQSNAAGSVTFTSAYLTTGDEDDEDDTETGISSIDNGNIVSVEYYSLSGQKLATPSTGVVIKKSTDASGNTSVKKVFVKTL